MDKKVGEKVINTRGLWMVQSHKLGESVAATVYLPMGSGQSMGEADV